MSCVVKAVDQETVSKKDMFSGDTLYSKPNTPCPMHLVYFQPNISICVSQNYS